MQEALVNAAMGASSTYVSDRSIVTVCKVVRILDLGSEPMQFCHTNCLPHQLLFLYLDHRSGLCL
jgi:hypothetical protein